MLSHCAQGNPAKDEDGVTHRHSHQHILIGDRNTLHGGILARWSRNKLRNTSINPYHCREAGLDNINNGNNKYYT